MDRGWTLLSVGTGAGLMYLLDPDRGRRRRALARDKAVRLSHEGRRALGLASRDLANRSRGLVADVRHRLASGGTTDDVLRERVRARIGHVVSHPHAIHVETEEGCVTLHGSILADELPGCLAACEGVPGVREVESELEVHEGPDIPALEGGARRSSNPAMRPTPAARLLATACGLGCALWGSRRGGALGFALRGLGLAILGAELAGTGAVQRLIAEATPRLERTSGG